MASDYKDKRRWGRITWTTPVHITDPTTGQEFKAEGRVRDISKSGFALAFEEQLKRGIQYKFIINRRVDPIEIRGHVVHVKNEKAYFIFGVKIDSLSLMQKSKFNRFLAQYSPQLQQKTLIYSFLGGLATAGLFYFLFGASAGTSLLIFMVASIFLKTFMPF